MGAGGFHRGSRATPRPLRAAKLGLVTSRFRQICQAIPDDRIRRPIADRRERQLSR